MSSETLAGLRVRASSAADLPLVEVICADVWGGTDYLPSVWAEWADHPRTQLYMYELDDQPAALYCLRFGMVEPGSSWLQGVRVATAFKRRGVGAALMEHAIAISRAQNQTKILYATADLNAPMHRLAERFGFRVVGKYLGSYHTLSGPIANLLNIPPEPVSLSELDEAYKLITSSAEYYASEGLYCNSWRWRPLSREVLQKHIERGEIFKLKGKLKALAIVTEGGTGEYWFSFAAGEPELQRELLTSIITEISKRKSTNGQKVEINALIPETAWNEILLAQCGFVPYDDAQVMYLYELPIS